MINPVISVDTLSFLIRQIAVDTARFKAPEGLLKAELFGIDSPTLPKLIEQTVQKCPLDVRREMWQSIYLSGGTTLIDGFPERLQKELQKAVPRPISVRVSSVTRPCVRDVGYPDSHRVPRAAAAGNNNEFALAAFLSAASFCLLFLQTPFFHPHTPVRGLTLIEK